MRIQSVLLLPALLVAAASPGAEKPMLSGLPS